MKKIFMIGKFNTIFQDVNHYLGKFFNVQVCVDNLGMIRGMLKINTPDLVIVSLIGMDRESSKIFTELKFNHSMIPVLCIGTDSEQVHFEEYFRIKQFSRITRPVSNDKIMESVCELLKISFDSEHEIVIEEKNSKKCILLVDDNALQLRSLNGMLNNKYEVRMATSGMNALTQIGKKVPDLIFLDYEMPMCDGKMTLQMIREVEEAKDIPVVFLTGVKDKEHIQAVLALKPAGYLLKPASADLIYETIEKILGTD